jgi:TBC1 domain family protein 5
MCIGSSIRVLEGESPSTRSVPLVLTPFQNFLLFQSTDVTKWRAALSDSRSAYGSLREHFLRFIENPDELGSALDPLDDDQHVGDRIQGHVHVFIRLKL